MASRRSPTSGPPSSRSRSRSAAWPRPTTSPTSSYGSARPPTPTSAARPSRSRAATSAEARIAAVGGPGSALALDDRHPARAARHLDDEAVLRLRCAGGLERRVTAGRTQLLPIEFDAARPADELELDVHAGRSLEAGVVRATHETDRDLAGRPAEREPKLIHAAVELE